MFIFSGTTTCFANGNEFIAAFFPGADDHMARNFGALAAYCVGTLIFAIVAFKIGGLKSMH
jgi:hypothetical protein